MIMAFENGGEKLMRTLPNSVRASPYETMHTYAQHFAEHYSNIKSENSAPEEKWVLRVDEAGGHLPNGAAPLRALVIMLAAQGKRSA
jgi:hypothetical protein